MKSKNKKYYKPKIIIKKIKLNFLQISGNFHEISNGFYPEILMAGSCVSCDCFIRDTKILLPDGKGKMIQNISESDEIVTYDVTNDKYDICRINKKIKYTRVDKGYLIINGELKITGNHRLWVNNSKWIRADDLKVNDFVMNNSKNKVKITKIERVDGRFDTYFLQLLNNYHTLFADNILVHE